MATPPLPARVVRSNKTNTETVSTRSLPHSRPGRSVRLEKAGSTQGETVDQRTRTGLSRWFRFGTGRRRRLVSLVSLVAIGIGGLVTVATTASAAGTNGDPIDWAQTQCIAAVAGSTLATNIDITVQAVVPNTEAQGAAYTNTIPGGTSTLPSTSSGFNISGYKNLNQTYLFRASAGSPHITSATPDGTAIEQRQHGRVQHVVHQRGLDRDDLDRVVRHLERRHDHLHHHRRARLRGRPGRRHHRQQHRGLQHPGCGGRHRSFVHDADGLAVSRSRRPAVAGRTPAASRRSRTTPR